MARMSPIDDEHALRLELEAIVQQVIHDTCGSLWGGVPPIPARYVTQIFALLAPPPATSSEQRETQSPGPAERGTAK